MILTQDEKAKQFYRYCRGHLACSSGLKAIRGKTFEEWWDGTKHGQYMWWLWLKANKIGYCDDPDRYYIIQHGFKFAYPSLPTLWLGRKNQSRKVTAAAAVWIRANYKIKNFLPYQKAEAAAKRRAAKSRA